MFSPVKVFTAALALCTVAVQAQPTFTKVFSGLLGFDDMATIDGPFGARALYTFTGGNLTDSNTGALAGTFLTAGGGDLGIASMNNGMFYANIRGILQWTDGTYAYLEAVGSGAFTGTVANTYLHVETNSSTYSGLETQFLFMDINVTTMPNVIGIYALN
ncbi:hypothetical protein BDZ89DRAFT_1068888 [Hymenopellis radicata]|nr:hypothetical protein BDZ89DRAFT_1068888 [Hymenopellis radicata]